MSFEWYRVAVFHDKTLAYSMSQILKVNSIVHEIRLDYDAYGIYVNNQSDIEKFNNLVKEYQKQLDTNAHNDSLKPNIEKQSDITNIEVNANFQTAIDNDEPIDQSAHQSVAFLNHHDYFLKHPAQIVITLAFVLFGVLGYFIAQGAVGNKFFYALLFVPLNNMFESQQIWRLLTPTFLHFNVLHIVFNALWIWVFGARIELSLGKAKTLFVFIGIAVGANIIQYLHTPLATFGGLSGVVYGLLGFLIIQHKAVPTSLNYLMPSLVVMMLIFMLLGMFGIIDVLLDGSIANGAHVGGFVLGIAFGVLLYFKPLLTRFR